MALKRLGLLALVMCAAVLFLFLRGPAPSVSGILTETAAERRFDVTVKTVGELDAARSTVISSALDGDGKIIFLVDDGVRVQAGDVLVRFDPSRFEEKMHTLRSKTAELEALAEANSQLLEWEKSQVEREIRTAQFDLEAARLDLIKLEKGEGPLRLAQLEMETRKAEREYVKLCRYLQDLEELSSSGSNHANELAEARKEKEKTEREYRMARQQLESYRDYVLPTEVQKAKATVARLEVNLEQTGKAGGFRIGKARAALRQSRQELDSTRRMLDEARQDLENTVLRAPIPGMAVLRSSFLQGERRKPRVGDTMVRNQPIVYLPDVSRMVVKTQIREVDLHKVAPGSPVRVQVDAYPDVTLEGHVSSLGVLARTEQERGGSEKWFSLTVMVDETDERLRPGMTVRAEIQCSEVSGLSVPVQAVFREQGGTYCYVESNGAFQRRTITTGQQNTEWVRVLDGLTEGERVALNNPESVRRDGNQG
jgi:HlyD family secretion protein